ncbi:MAG: XRE family transcriptional regulator [Bacteroidota bacterium]
MKNAWFLLENEADYEKASARFQEIKYAKKGSIDHKEKMLLAFLIDDYGKAHSTLPELDPIEFIKIRMTDFGYKPADLAREYGDKGTVSKVLNYKQALSLTMIRKFSKILRIPVDALTKEYELQ